MAIRLRSVDGVRVALCAAETSAQPDDTYLDDNDHYALAAKFSRDWRGRYNDVEYPDEWSAMNTQVNDGTFRLSNRSRDRLEGVHPHLVGVIHHAIHLTQVDFTVLEGVRSVERQRQLVAKGASRTMLSRHLSGHAVDLGAWIAGNVSWDWGFYYEIAAAMREAAMGAGVPLEWGGVWDREMTSLTQSGRTMKDEVAVYVKRFKQRHKRNPERSPLLDGVHFQLPSKHYPASIDVSSDA